MVVDNIQNAQTSIQKVKSEHGSLAILRLMMGELGSITNDELLSHCLCFYALGCGRDELREQLRSLERMGMLKIEQAGALLVVEIAERGREVAEGRTTTEGILRAWPDCPY
ncbi:VpaChn25_0724 family phage protein [Tistrella mobilis]